MINKFNSKIVSTALLFASQAATVYAQALPGNLPPVNTTNSIDIPRIIENIMNFGVALLVALAAIFILWAAYMYLTAGAIEDNLTKAKQYMLYAIIAIFVALIAKAIPIVVKGLFPGA